MQSYLFRPEPIDWDRTRFHYNFGVPGPKNKNKNNVWRDRLNDKQ